MRCVALRWSTLLTKILLMLSIATLPLLPLQVMASDRPLLKLGMQGTDVQEVQALLTLLGYYQGPIDGTYSEATLIAVTQFQESAGLSQDGVLGGQTWLKLLPKADLSMTSSSIPKQPVVPGPDVEPVDQPTAKPAAKPTAKPAEAPESMYPILRKGAKGNAVVRLQTKLRSRGFLSATPDGDFGEATEKAVKDAQTYYKLVADGVVGGATWDALNR